MSDPVFPGPAPYRFLVTGPLGLESLLAAELRELGLEPQLEASGAVEIRGDWATAATVLVRSRIASRLLLSLRRFSARNRAMLYDQVRRIDWPRVFSYEHTLSVEALGSARGSDFTLPYATLRIKDAICDEFRKHGGPRPDVERAQADAPIRAFFHNGRCELSLDLSGEPLHRRGYRTQGAEAPLRENRAAALLAFAGYDGSQPFVDPFCGSGTLPIEAAWIATRTAPGMLRDANGYAMTRLFLPAVDPLGTEREAARSEARSAPPAPIRGSDRDPERVAIAGANAKRAGTAGWIAFSTADALDLEAPGSLIATNPPYGERLDDPETAAAGLREFTHRVKHHAVDSTLALVVPRGPLEKSVGLKPDAKLALASAALELRFLRYAIRAGRFRPAPSSGTSS